MRASYIIRPEVAGGLGDQSQLDQSSHPPRVTRLHYVFSGWAGDDIAESFPCYIVTERLADAITAAALTGTKLAEVYVTKDAQFEKFFPEIASSLPAWKWLHVLGGPDDDFWLDDQALLHASKRAYALLSGFKLNAAEVREA